ncbi:AAA family ATPase [Motilimonas pumila]|uniref:CbbQ/NirQ/NorQ/GpvN family protein n=1 Tax=Motilimonas pumila TaxID=2303987 RepID=A0A418YA34_9GAMM|nr:AAA family ATPase [Motilimonas pumila]RJG38784.1 hypothetical protein D1Z90_18745 [Motilimonas pumila]
MNGEIKKIDMGGHEVPCFVFEDDMNPMIPQAVPHFYSKEELMVIRAFMEMPFDDYLYIYGDFGTGKTSGIEYYCAKTHRPLVSFCCASDTEIRDMLIINRFIDGSLRQELGVLSLAYKMGYTVLINEVDLLSPSELTSLNELVGGNKPITLHETGETIWPHPQFRFVCTANTNGSGDSRGLYQGTGILNKSFIDRCRMLETKYLPPDLEDQVIKEAVPSLPDAVREIIIDIANDVRDLFNPKRTDPSSSDAPKLSSVISTRTLIRWARMIEMFKDVPDGQGFWLSLEQSFTASLTPHEKLAVLEVAKARSGF